MMATLAAWPIYCLPNVLLAGVRMQLQLYQITPRKMVSEINLAHSRPAKDKQ